LAGSFEIPLHGLNRILQNAVTGMIPIAEPVLRGGEALLGGFSIPLRCFD
jgi:hypothetical protein